MKICGKCKNNLALSAFTKDKNRPDGLFIWCGKCRSAYRAEAHAAAHPERRRVTSKGTMVYKDKVCIDCQKLLPFSQFYRKRSAADGKTSYCIECSNARSVKWHREQTNKKPHWRLAWRQKTPRQTLNTTLYGALKRKPSKSPPTVDDLMQMFAAQNGRCAVSGIEFTWAKGKLLPTSITLDRIDQKGDYSKGNIRLVCHAVNAFRGIMTDEEMFAMARTIVMMADAKLLASDPTWFSHTHYQQDAAIH